MVFVRMDQRELDRRLARELDKKSDLQLERLILSGRFDAFVRMVARRKAGGLILSSGEQRLVDMLKKVTRVSDYWIDQQWSAEHAVHMAAAE
jgi:hypothetical protein